MKAWRMRWEGHVARMWAKMNAYRIVVGNPEGKIAVGKQDVGGRKILSRVLVTETRVWIRNRFIGQLPVVTTENYNTPNYYWNSST
jgi:hypothetical protein